MTTLIRWLYEVEDDQMGLVGGKGANLGRLVAMGLPVPPGFVVTTEAYRGFLAANDLANVDPEKLGEYILAGAIPNSITAQVLAAYQQLDKPAVAVRSSGTAEDLSTASFAGQHDTFLNVAGSEEVLAAVRACWASLWSARAIEYRRQRRWDDRDLALAIVIQAMVPAEWAGVLFTVDPVMGDRGSMIVEAVPGLGEALVLGEVTGRRYSLAKTSLQPMVRNADLPFGLLEELARLGKQVEDSFGRPQDIEWAYANGRCYLLQARPLTALPTEPTQARPATLSKSRRSSRVPRAAAANAMEHMPLPPYPFDYSLFFHPMGERLFDAVRSLGVSLPALDDVFIEVADGVVQVIPPTARPTLKVLTLPLKLVRALRSRPADWLAECRRTLVTTARQIDGEDLSILAEPELLARIETLRCLQLKLVVPRFARFPRGILVSRGLTLLLCLALGRQAQDLEHKLLTDIPCVTTEANRDLERLAQHIHASDELRAVFSEERPERLPIRLSETTVGRALVNEVNGFLERFGYRETVMPSAAFPAWRDDPGLVYGLLKGLVIGKLSTADVKSPNDERAERAKQTAIIALSGSCFGLGSRFLVSLFLKLLEETRTFLAFREDSHFYLFMAFPVIRRLALELGGRLMARSVLEKAEDIFFLELDEIKERGLVETVQETVRKRKEARRSEEGRYTVIPVELLEKATSNDEVQGVPVSPGQAVGQVRIVLSERDFWKLQKGEVLVARYTNPAWTPLFALAGAVVVDAGGVASHAAIVAREYGIPAVMGTSNATTRLAEGQRVLVDGETGRVVPLHYSRTERRI